MKKVITYGTYDLLHYGHIRLLERAKELGDYLIVGVTADDYDKTRGKINVQQPLMERIEAVRSTGLADEIIIEEYEGQKIDDILKYDVDVFTVGSDWMGKFDYLKEYCEVVYLDRTKGVSSSELRAEDRKIRIGIVGNLKNIQKFIKEAMYVNGVEIKGICTNEVSLSKNSFPEIECLTDDYSELLQYVDAVYIISHPLYHYSQIKEALGMKKHVLCESPMALKEEECKELFDYAQKQECILMEAIKTAYSTAYSRLMLLAKTGKIGDIISVDAVCTSLQITEDMNIDVNKTWSSICSWGPTALLPIFQLLGTSYKNKVMVSQMYGESNKFDVFTKIDFIYDNAVASVKVGKGVKSEGQLIITGTKGYIYVPAPWWKTDYFEVRYEDMENNQRYFYQLDGEGIRYEIVAFAKAISTGKYNKYLPRDISSAISNIMDSFYYREDEVIRIN